MYVPAICSVQARFMENWDKRESKVVVYYVTPHFVSVYFSRP